VPALALQILRQLAMPTTHSSNSSDHLSTLGDALFVSAWALADLAACHAETCNEAVLFQWTVHVWRFCFLTVLVPLMLPSILQTNWDRDHLRKRRYIGKRANKANRPATGNEKPSERDSETNQKPKLGKDLDLECSAPSLHHNRNKVLKLKPA
jgi:hypothetical protein